MYHLITSLTRLNRTDLRAVLGVLVLFSFVGCEDTEVVPPTGQDVASERYFIARAGEDRNMLTGDTINLSAIFARNQSSNSFKWRFLSTPENSKVSLNNPNQPTTWFEADQQGIYTLELGMFFDRFSTFDTVKVSAFTISHLNGSYQTPEIGANGMIREFKVFQGQLYAAGDFTSIGGVAVSGLARFDGSRWSAVGSGDHQERVYNLVEYQGKLYVSGSSRVAAKEEEFSVTYWDGQTWKGLGFTGSGKDLVILNNELYLNFGDRVASWDGMNLKYLEVPGVDEVTYLETLNDLLYVRGLSDSNCVSSTKEDWVYDCQAIGYLLQYDGNTWNEVRISDESSCFNTGLVYWNDHEWIETDPNLNWDFMIRYQNKLFFPCGYSENDTFTEFSYPFAQTIMLQRLSESDLFISGRSQKIANDYNGVMRWDGNQWYTYGEGVEGQVLTVEEFQGNLYIGGSFAYALGSKGTNYTVWRPN
jgi:hypothetical protein